MNRNLEEQAGGGVLCASQMNYNHQATFLLLSQTQKLMETKKFKRGACLFLHTILITYGKYWRILNKIIKLNIFVM